MGYRIKQIINIKMIIIKINKRNHRANHEYIRVYQSSLYHNKKYEPERDLKKGYLIKKFNISLDE
jgi:hypothetical protein